MADSNLIQHNYSEDEVWDLLTEYLEKQHQATKTSVQQRIYADFHSEGSIFLVDECEDEFATLYCFRNINYNIYGSVIYQLDSQYSEEFTLKSICEFLGKPFPKTADYFGFSDEEIEDNKIRIKLNEQSKLNLEKKDQQEKINRYTAISLLYAFEYFRAEQLNDRSFHMSQFTKDPSRSSFVLSHQINHIEQIRVINPNTPTIKELMVFLNKKKTLDKYYGVDFNDVYEIATTLFDQKYETFFSEQARRVGSLLYPLYNLDNELVSSLNIIDIKDTNNDKEFLLIKNEANTIGSIQHHHPDDNNQIIFITEKVTTADTLKTLFTNHPVHGCLSARNLIKVTRELSAKHPDSFILIVLENEYIKFMSEPNINRFNKSPLVKLAQFIKDNPEDLLNIGLIFARTESNLSPYSDIHELFLNLDKEEVKGIIQNEISAFVERYENGVHELNYLLEQHNEYTKMISEKIRTNLPKLILDTSSPIDASQFNQPLDTATVLDAQPNSVLFKERQVNFSEWLKHPPSKEFIEETRAFDEAWVKFANTAISENEDEDIDF